MKINKNSWHYRLVLKQVKNEICPFNESYYMPDTSCAYFAKLIKVAFLNFCKLVLGLFVLGMSYGFSWAVIEDPLPLICVLVSVSLAIGLTIGLRFLSEMISGLYWPIKLRLKQFCLYRLYWPIKLRLKKFCAKIEYT
ncbi:MAG: hypothetical protein WC460_04085 [Patescibacteria group bacterium]